MHRTSAESTGGRASRFDQFVDKLTGLPSWTQFHEALRLEVSAAHRRGRRVSVLVLELGEPEIDDLRLRMAVLTRAGKILKLATGPSGMLARSSGNQFAVLLADRDIVGAHVIAERLCTAIALQFDPRQCHVLGAGVASGPEGSDWSGRELLDLATWRCRRVSAGEVCSFGSPAPAPHWYSTWP